ncbi:MAG TPA: hypothetical protein VH575_35955, partial [Gemmataceae bacterium]
TSAYLLKHVLDAYGGKLPANVLTCFANTGKEMPETLDFVRDCGQRWNVNIVWLEYDPSGETQRKFRIVGHGSASRQGEPYEALLRERKYLPNPVTRFCTTTLLCVQPHNRVCVVILFMWRSATILGELQGFPRRNVT